MAEIQKGKISSIEATPLDTDGLATKAKVFSLTGGSVTMPLTIPWYLRGTMGNLAADVEVVFALFEDKTGYIIGRADGEFQGHIPYNTIFDKNVDITQSLNVTENANAADFVSQAYGSTNEHTHTDSQNGKKTPPN